jgi:MFS family permease
MLRTLRQRDFALVWWGGLISLSGDRVFRTALPFYIYAQTGSTLATAGMYLMTIVPHLVLGSVAGVFVDRWSRRRIMLVTNLARGILLLPLLVVTAQAELWIIYSIAALESALSTFFRPAENALLPQLVPDEQFLTANALNSLNNNLARLIAPPIGGALLGLAGLSSVVLIDSLSYFIAGALLIPRAQQPESVSTKVNRAPSLLASWQQVRGEWWQGLQLVRRRRALVALFVAVGLMTFGGTMIDPLIAPFMEDIVRAGAVGLGWLLTAQAAGGLLGGVIIGRWGMVLSASKLFGTSCALTGILIMLMYNLPILWIVLVLAFLGGGAAAGASAGWQTLLQQQTPAAYRGRVFGALETTSALLELLSVGVAGVLGEIVSLIPLLTVAGGVTILAGVVALLALPHAQRRTI